MNVKTEALAYRIWGYATPLGWNCTSAEVADSLGETPARIRRVSQLKKWTSRFRVPVSYAEHESFRAGGNYLATEVGGQTHATIQEMQPVNFDA
jgi:hypothetical protein